MLCFSIMRHKYISKRRNFISFRMHLRVVSHNSLHNELPCLRMLNLNQKAPRVFFSLFPYLSSSLFCSDPLGCVANSHLTQLHASSLTDCNSQPKAGHTVKRLYTGAQPNASQWKCVNSYQSRHFWSLSRRQTVREQNTSTKSTRFEFVQQNLVLCHVNTRETEGIQLLNVRGKPREDKESVQETIWIIWRLIYACYTLWLYYVIHIA